MIDFLIFYEVKNREFDSIVLLKNELTRRGYSVEFCSFFELDSLKLVRKFRNNVKVAVMPSLYHDEEIQKIVYWMAGNVRAIVDLKWEQALTNRAERDTLDYSVPKGRARECIHCCWGNRPKQVLQKAGIDEKLLPVTGAIMMDLTKPIFHQFFLNKKDLLTKYNINPKKPCILFISSYAIATMPDSQIEVVLQQWGEKRRAAGIEKIENDKVSYKKTIEWLIALKKTADCNIIYRPHPTEHMTETLQEAINREYLYCIKDESVKQWILASDYVYTWTSTSISESYMLGKKCAIIRPIPIQLEDDMGLYNDAQFIENEENFIESYYNPVTKEYINKEVINSYFYTDSDFAFNRVADILELALESGEEFDWTKYGPQIKYNFVKDYIYEVLRKPYHLFFEIYDKIFKDDFNSSIGKKVKNYKRNTVFNHSQIITENEFRMKEKELYHVVYVDGVEVNE